MKEKKKNEKKKKRKEKEKEIKDNQPVDYWREVNGVNGLMYSTSLMPLVHVVKKKKERKKNKIK